ncbi:Transmembrane protein TauE-like protein [Dioscorea alata]|uniref:Transmembrane protein TauE-like protein n=1 Tax=Dioscorea alata TaxID=55571 RepID=A0ACB7UP15_DIOAL|nr:Transmembrane protein TauE-like protein [Dioscorea alata]
MEFVQGMSSKDIKTVIAWILCFLAASISSAGGVGGGSLFLPILNLVAGLQIRTAATFSAFMVTGGSLTTVIYNLFVGTSLIDYEITLLSQPCLLLGVSVGVFFNIMFPEWLITVLFATFLAFSTFKTCSAGVRHWKNETEEIRRSRDCGDDEVSLEVATAMDVEIVCATVGTPWAKLVILVVVWLSFFGLHVLLADKDGQSFIHIKPCAVGYWLITLSQIPLAIGFTLYILYAKHRLYNEDHHENKHMKNIVSQNGISTQPKFIFPVAALLSGIVGGLLGIGGGLLINPVLLQIGVPPQTTAATTCFMVLFSSSMSSAQYLILGMKGVKQALVYAQLCIVGSALGLIMMERVVIKSGRASLIVFMVSIVMALSTVSITSFGAIDVWSDYTDGKYMGFKLPC